MKIRGIELPNAHEAMQHAEASGSPAGEAAHCGVCAEYRQGLDAMMSGLRPPCALLDSATNKGRTAQREGFSMGDWEWQGNWLMTDSPPRPDQERAGQGPDHLVWATLPARD